MFGHDDNTRKVVHASVCAPAAEMLRAFCVAHGVTITAFLDALAHTLGGIENAQMDRLKAEAPTLAEALRDARTIDALRRSREPKLDRPGNNGGA